MTIVELSVEGLPSLLQLPELHAVCNPSFNGDSRSNRKSVEQLRLLGALWSCVLPVQSECFGMELKRCRTAFCFAL